MYYSKQLKKIYSYFYNALTFYYVATQENACKLSDKLSISNFTIFNISWARPYRNW